MASCLVTDTQPLHHKNIQRIFAAVNLLLGKVPAQTSPVFAIVTNWSTRLCPRSAGAIATWSARRSKSSSSNFAFSSEFLSLERPFANVRLAQVRIHCTNDDACLLGSVLSRRKQATCNVLKGLANILLFKVYCPYKCWQPNTHTTTGVC